MGLHPQKQGQDQLIKAPVLLSLPKEALLFQLPAEGFQGFGRSAFLQMLRKGAEPLRHGMASLPHPLSKGLEGPQDLCLILVQLLQVQVLHAPDGPVPVLQKGLPAPDPPAPDIVVQKVRQLPVPLHQGVPEVTQDCPAAPGLRQHRKGCPQKLRQDALPPVGLVIHEKGDPCLLKGLLQKEPVLSQLRHRHGDLPVAEALLPYQGVDAVRKDTDLLPGVPGLPDPDLRSAVSFLKPQILHPFQSVFLSQGAELCHGLLREPEKVRLRSQGQIPLIGSCLPGYGKGKPQTLRLGHDGVDDPKLHRSEAGIAVKDHLRPGKKLRTKNVPKQDQGDLLRHCGPLSQGLLEGKKDLPKVRKLGSKHGVFRPVPDLQELLRRHIILIKFRKG